MHAIWRGAISFGLITIPVRLFGATEEKSLRFNQLHVRDMGRIRNSRTCTVCGETGLGKEDLARGFEYEKGRYVTLDDAELEAVPVSTLHTIDVLSFVPASQIDPVYFNRSYYLAPEQLGAKPYALLRKALAVSDKVALAKVALRDKERLATLRVRDEVIVMETMYWPDEIREPVFPEIQPDVAIGERELAMARTLIDSLSEDFDPAQFTDEYRSGLLELVEAKVAGRKIVAPEPASEAAPVVDIMEALQKSLEMVRNRRAQAG